MIKKLLLLVVLLMPSVALAQYGTGSWKIHPNFIATRLQNCVDTGDKVYYLVSNSLYRLDKTTHVNESLNNQLSDVTITNIYYNDRKNYLLLTYDNSNIDIILGDGRIINMPEIKDAVLSQTKAINHVNFVGDKAYLATDFGYVTIDDNKFVMSETRIFGEKLLSVIEVHGQIFFAQRSTLFYASANSPHETISQFRGSTTYRNDMQLVAIDNDHMFLNVKDSLELCTFSSTGAMSFKTIAPNKATSIQRTPTGFVASFPDHGYYVTTDANGDNPVKTACGNEMFSCNPKGDGTMWVLSGKGVSKASETSNPYLPDGIGIQTSAFWTAYNPGNHKIYLSSTTDNALLTSANQNAKTEIWTYDGKQWQDVTPPNVPIYKNSSGSTAGYQGNYWLSFTQGEPENYVFACRAAGVCHVVNGTVVNTYKTGTNCPIKDKYKPATAFDSEGNLWLAQSYGTTGGKAVAVLPKAKLANPTAVKTTDWYTPNVPNMEVGAFKRSMFVVSKKDDIKVYTSGDFQKQVVFWDDNHDITNLNPATRSYTQFKDVDSKTFSWNNVICLYAAEDGKVWIGTNAGIASFDPKEAFNTDFRINHMKAMSEDGLSEDYLVDGLQVNCITEDDQQRKWIGTNTDGLYIVTPDGSKVLHHFNTQNSVMQSNTVYSVCYNPTTSSAIIVTSNGVCEYVCDITPSGDNYDNVSVYPNPVRPDFTGYVTITGLMNNSHVTITDASGKVYKELVSDGGVCSWDCTDPATGFRATTGTYTVNAATSASAPHTPVATFFIIK